MEKLMDWIMKQPQHIKEIIEIASIALIYAIVILLVIIFPSSFGWVGITLLWLIMGYSFVAAWTVIKNADAAALNLVKENGRVSLKKWDEWLIIYNRRFRRPILWISLVVTIAIAIALWKIGMIYTLVVYMITFAATEAAKQKAHLYLTDKKNRDRYDYSKPMRSYSADLRGQ